METPKTLFWVNAGLSYSVHEGMKLLQDAGLAELAAMLDQLGGHITPLTATPGTNVYNILSTGARVDYLADIFSLLFQKL